MNEFKVPSGEIEFRYSRSSGPGGQHVNKTNTAVQLRWEIAKSSFFSEDQKLRIQQALQNRITKEGELLIECSEFRDRDQNIRVALAKMNRLVAGALKERKKRRKTRPPPGVKLKRLESKKKHQQKKRDRRKWKED